MAFDAIILAGARSERLNGADKASVMVGGQTLLQRAVAATKDARRIFVVGPRRNIPLEVDWVQDDNGGPVAAIAAGIRKVQNDNVVVLAVDYPCITADEVADLVACMGCDGAIAIDGAGRRQPLLAAYATRALVTAIARMSLLEGARTRDLVSSLDLNEVAFGDAASDCDTWDDIAAVSASGRVAAVSALERVREG